MTFAIEVGNELGFLPFAKRSAIVKRVTAVGGRIAPVVDETTTAVLSRRHTASEFDGSLTLQHAARNGVPIVAAHAFLKACEETGACAPLSDFVVKIVAESKELRAIVANLLSAQATMVGKATASHAAAVRFSLSIRRSVVRRIAEEALRQDTTASGRAKWEQSHTARWYESYDETRSAAERSTAAPTDDPDAFPPRYPVDTSVDADSAGYEVLRSHGLACGGLELHGAVGATVVKPFRVLLTRTRPDRSGGAVTCKAAFFVAGDAAEACYEAAWREFASDAVGATTLEAGAALDTARFGSRALKRIQATRFARRFAPTMGAGSADPTGSAIAPGLANAVRMWFAEAWALLEAKTSAAAAGNATSALGRVSLLDVHRAEAVLLALGACLREQVVPPQVAGATGSPSPSSDADRVVKLSTEYNKLIPPPTGDAGSPIDTPEKLADAEDTLRLLRAVLSVGEEVGGNVFMLPPAGQYRSLGCELSRLEPNVVLVGAAGGSHGQLRELLRRDAATNAVTARLRRLTGVYEVRREDEHRAFAGAKVGNVHLLLHGTAVGAVAPILAQGLAVPKAARLRRDRGMLGRGIYFGDDLETALRYARRSFRDDAGVSSESRPPRVYVLVADVAPGKTYETARHLYDLEAPPPGYDSVRGLRSEDGTTDFRDDEFVVYAACAQRLRYVLEFTLLPGGPEPAPSVAAATKAAVSRTLPPVAPAFESLVGNKGLVEPVEELSGPVKVKEVKAGLQSTSDDPVPLRSTRVKAAVIDLIAEVTLFQEYENTGDASIEAKYVFPLQRGRRCAGSRRSSTRSTWWGA
jgi:hypothetical protein